MISTLEPRDILGGESGGLAKPDLDSGYFYTTTFHTTAFVGQDLWANMGLASFATGYSTDWVIGPSAPANGQMEYNGPGGLFAWYFSALTSAVTTAQSYQFRLLHWFSEVPASLATFVTTYPPGTDDRQPVYGIAIVRVQAGDLFLPQARCRSGAAAVIIDELSFVWRRLE